MKFRKNSIILTGFFAVTTLIIFSNQSSAAIEFEDVTEQAGISYKGPSWGSAWGDLNGDGLPDLWTTNHGQVPNLFLNNGDGTFTDVSLKVGFDFQIGPDNHGSSWADYDNDGDQDLLVLTGAKKGEGTGPNLLLENNNGMLQNKADVLELDYSLGRGRTPLWFDFDNDGLLDVLITNAVRPDQKAPTALFQQTSERFLDITESSELKFQKDVGSAQISDLTQDGKTDLIIMIFSTQGIFEGGSFPFNNIQKELNLPEFFATDLVVGDFNGDLLQDIFFVRMNKGISEKIQDFEIFQQGNFFINTENGFQDNTKLSGLDKPTACRSVVGGDFDNDMDLDIYSVCSFDVTNQPNLLFENQGNGNFVIFPKAGGAEGSSEGVGDSVTTADYDGDGFLDIFVTNGFGAKPYSENGSSQLFHNLGNNNHWIEIDLSGKISNHDGIGARVIVTTDEVKQLREQNGGMHYRSQNHQRLHFGLGQNSVIDSIVVFWPSGLVQEINQISSDQILEITEPLMPIPPKHQTRLGLESSKVICKEGLFLILKKSDDSAACVKESSINILFKRGWGI